MYCVEKRMLKQYSAAAHDDDDGGVRAPGAHERCDDADV
jgi:hypothetical protein